MSHLTTNYCIGDPQDLQNVVAIEKYHQISANHCEGNNGENGYSVQGLVAKVQNTVASV